MRRHTRWLFGALAFALSLAIVWIYLVDPGMNGFFAATFHDSLHGTAFKPYVYRALVPWIVSAVVAVMPDGLKAGLVGFAFTNPAAVETLRRAQMHPSVAPDLAVFLPLSVAMAFAFRASIRRTCLLAYPGHPLFAEITSLVTLAGVQSLFSYTSYVYDFATLLFAALCLELLVREKWVWFAAVLALGFFNKETLVLFGLAFAVLGWKSLPRRRFFAIASGIALAYGASRIVLNALYGDNFGEFTTLHLVDHNRRLLRSYAVQTFVAWTVGVAFVFERWAAKPRSLKVVLTCLTPLLGACLLFGYFDELRDYYELYPAIMLLAAPGVARMMSVDVLRRPPVTEN